MCVFILGCIKLFSYVLVYLFLALHILKILISTRISLPGLAYILNVLRSIDIFVLGLVYI